MRLNEHTGKVPHSCTSFPSQPSDTRTTAISNPNLLLVPYSTHHVPTYHGWMQSPALQSATASEPLTLDQEHAMQASWRRDGDKLTFIVCLPLPLDNDGEDGVKGGVDDLPARMLGDVNLFLSEPDSEDEGGVGAVVVGELELMIALPELQHRGYGRGALLAFMAYVLTHWSEIAREYGAAMSSALQTGPALAYFRAKINETNVRSIALFQSLGFTRTAAEANYFGEVELRWRGEVEDLERCKGWQRSMELRYA